MIFIIKKRDKKRFISKNLLYISKEDLLVGINKTLDPCIKLGEWNKEWQFLDEEDSIIPYDAGRIQSIIERIFDKKIETMSKNKQGIFVKFYQKK